MKLYIILLIFALIYIVSSSQICDSRISAYSYNEFKNYELPPGTKHCCYYYYWIREQEFQSQTCGALTEDEYENIEETKIKIRKEIEAQGYTILDFILDCGKSTQMCDSTIKASSYNECKNYELPPGKQHCCYIHDSEEYQGIEQDKETCSALTEEEYEKIDTLIEEYKEEAQKKGIKVKKFIVDCGKNRRTLNGKYIQISILTLLFLFLN